MPMPIKAKEKIQTAKKRLKATVVSFVFSLLNIIKYAFIFEIIKLEVFKLYSTDI